MTKTKSQFEGVLFVWALQFDEPEYKETQKEMRNKVTDLYQSVCHLVSSVNLSSIIEGYKAMSKAFRVPLNDG